HDQPDDAEEDGRQVANEIEHGLAMLARQHQSGREQNGNEQNLQHVALGEGGCKRCVNDVQQKIDEALVLGVRRINGPHTRIQYRRIDVHARAGTPDIDHDECYDERGGGENFEIDDGLDGDAAYLLHVVHRGHAVDDGAENDGGDDHPQKRDEDIAQG